MKTAATHLKEPFVCLYGDSVYEFPLDKMIENHFEDKAFISMALSRYKTNLKYGFIELSDDEKMLVSEWKEKPEISGLINIGCYVFRTGILRFNSNFYLLWNGRGGKRINEVKKESKVVHSRRGEFYGYWR